MLVESIMQGLNLRIGQRLGYVDSRKLGPEVRV
jgi:hypothetical protein